MSARGHGPRQEGAALPVAYARSGNTNIAYQVVGSGPIDIVMSPGWITHLDLGWDVTPLARFYRRLGTFARVILSTSAASACPTACQMSTSRPPSSEWMTFGPSWTQPGRIEPRCSARSAAGR